MTNTPVPCAGAGSGCGQRYAARWLVGPTRVPSCGQHLSGTVAHVGQGRFPVRVMPVGHRVTRDGQDTP